MMLRYIAAVAASMLVAAATANAEIVSIPGAAFQPDTPSGLTLNQFPDLVNGTLVANSMATLVAPVDFPKNGQKICKMTLVYEDSNGAENIQMRLLRKSSASGSTANAPPAQLAQVSSAGSAANSVRRASTKAISPRTVDDSKGFYYVRTSFINVNLSIVGVEFDVRTTCP